MWLFTKYGFFSVVCARKDPEIGSGVETETLMVRARAKKHLENLAESFQDLNELQIATTYGTDYRHRILVPKKVWSSIMTEMPKEIDYGNFKDKVHSAMQDEEFSRCLGDVWGIMHGYQDE